VYHRESDGKELVFFTNDLTRSAVEIADLYQQRWQIELFFKWIKQNLKIKRFYGTSENAVKLQVLVAMIS
jgi:putative transposase